MIEIVHGDLLKAIDETYICHQVNCITTTSAHLSRAVFKRFPYADIYTGRETKDIPGTIQVMKDPKHDDPLVINLLGQVYPGESRWPRSGTDGLEVRFKYFKSCLSYMVELDGTFAFPWRIGCGAAGGDWDRYFDALLTFSEQVDDAVTIYKLKFRPVV